MQLYRKTSRNMDEMARSSGNAWTDPPVDTKRDLAARLFHIANQHNILLTICSQPEIVTCQPASRCIDAGRLSDVAGQAIAARMLGNRPGCECAANRDIGDYDTCPHGCVYCYAVRSNELAINRFRDHSPESEYLFDDPTAPQDRARITELPVQGRLDI
jgi:hypothetical protein